GTPIIILGLTSLFILPARIITSWGGITIMTTSDSAIGHYMTRCPAKNCGCGHYHGMVESGKTCSLTPMASIWNFRQEEHTTNIHPQETKPPLPNLASYRGQPITGANCGFR